MSIFERLGTPPDNRRTLFWLVCILVRLLLATSFTLFTLYGNPWVAYVVGGIGIGGGLGFWRQRCADNKPNIWWYRIAHGFIWISGGVGTIVFRSQVGADAAAAFAGAFFFFDVLFGIATALLGSRNPWESYAINPPRFISFEGATLWGENDASSVFFTSWTFVHLGVSSAFGVGAYFLDKGALGGESLWVVCLVASFGILGWEAAENTALDFKRRIFGISRIDSDANLAGDIAVGFIGLWATAFLLRAAGA